MKNITYFENLKFEFSFCLGFSAYYFEFDI